MKRGQLKLTEETFYLEIQAGNAEACCQMIRDGILEQIENAKLKDVFLRLMKLRSKEVIALLAKRSHYFPMEMLEMEIGNQKDKEFLSYVLTKHGKKFPYKEPENANRLFQIGCAAECAPVLLFLMKKGLAEGEYPRLISGSQNLVEVLDQIRVAGLHPDTVVTFFVEAAVSEKPEDRIRILQHLKFEILTQNSEGLNACDVLQRGIETYDYGKGKQARIERQRDLQGLKTLQRFYTKALG